MYALIQSQYDRALDCTISDIPEQGLKTLPDVQSSLLPSNVKGKDLFDSALWKDPLSTSVFYKFTASLRRKIREDIKHSTPTHRFIRNLRDSRKLVRCYTQNIDGLEARQGLCTDLSCGKGNRSRFAKKVVQKPSIPALSSFNNDQDGGCEVVQLHGDLEVLRCNFCQKTCGWEDKGREGLLLAGEAPECLSCAVSDQQRRDRGKRGTKVGTLRPNIVLYGEEHPSADMLGAITAYDLRLAPDVLLILGTSLHVHGLKTLVKEFAKSVRARPGGRGKVIFVNLSKPPESVWKHVIDYWVSMDCDEWVSALRRHRPDLWQIQKDLKLQVTKRNSEKFRYCPSDELHKMKVEEEKENAGLTQRHCFISRMTRDGIPGKKRRPLSDASVRAGSRNPANIYDTEPSCAKSNVKASHQIPSPPPSGHRARFTAGLKRPLSVVEESALPLTPSKRGRTGLDIWEDEVPLSKKFQRASDSVLDITSRVIKTPSLRVATSGRKAKMTVERCGRLR